MNNANNNSAKNHKKPKRKFNIVDFLILLLILTVIATAIFAIASWSSIEKLWTSNKVSLQYTVELRGVDAEFINNIKPGDAVSDSVTKTQLGTVNRVDSIEKYTVLSYEAKEVSKEDGSLETVYNGVNAEYGDKYNVTVYISSTAEYVKGTGYTVNGTRVAVGEVLNLRFPKFSSTAYCIAGNFN